jgi:hypothetical protein
MPSEHPEKDNGAPQPPENRVVVEQSTDDQRLIDSMHNAHASEEQYQARARAWDEMVSELAAITDESDSDEIWSEVLHNLGVNTNGEGD